jgi:hypothetical protein
LGLLPAMWVGAQHLVHAARSAAKFAAPPSR